MKRIFALLLVLCLLLCACGRKEIPYPTKDSADNNTTENTTEDVTQDTTEEQKEPVVLYRHPLTGEPLDAPWNGQVTGVMINNLVKAMPQKGISQADIFYEIEVEGDITRCLALFTDFSDVGDIGPVRSARTAFNSVAVSYDAPLIHCGGSFLALKAMYGDYNDTISKWEHIDADSTHFYRDKDRYNSGYAWEHTLFTKGELLQKALKAYGYDTPTDNTYGLNFSDEVALEGEKAEEVTVKFKSGKSTTLKYDTATGRYTLYMHGKDAHIDGNTGEAVTFKNVIAIYTKQWYHSNGMHKFYDTIGSGEGYAAINGKIVPITWSRESLRKPYTYALKDGTPLTLETGTTYIALVGIKNPIAYK